MFKVINGGKMPTKGSKYSAAVDLYASEDVVIGAGDTAVVGLGVCIDNDFISKYIEILQDEKYNEIECYSDGNWIDFFKLSHYLELHPRSSLRAKGLISNTGIIDLDYKDEIKIIIHNSVKVLDSIQYENYISIKKVSVDNDFVIKKGDKIAQILLKEHKSYLFDIETDKARNGGFGSTDDEIQK